MYMIIQKMSCRKKSNFYWLKMYEHSEETEYEMGSSGDQDYNEMKDKNSFWKRVKLTMNMNIFLIYYSQMTYTFIAFYFFYMSTPEEYFLTYRLFNYIQL